MSQHSQQNDGPFDSQLQFFPTDSPTIGRSQTQLSANNSSPVVTESGKRFVTLGTLRLHVTSTYKGPFDLGLSARLLPVLYKRALLLHLLPVVSRQQELPFRELPAIILRNPQAHIITFRKHLVRRRSVLTTCWPLRGASIQPKTRQSSLFPTRITRGILESRRFSSKTLTPIADTIVLSTIRMVPLEAFPILS